MGALPPVFIEFLGNATGFMATKAGVISGIKQVEAEGGGSLSKFGAVSQAALIGIGAAAVGAAVKTTEMAANFQTAMTRVQTGAGESASNMKMVGDGVLSMAGQVGQSTEQLTKGLYMVESAGYHGKDALDVLKVSAMGAKVGAAELGTVTDAVTTAMNAYGLKAKDTTSVMNALVATEGQGKTNMEALAGSMASILPVASAAHVGLNEVLGAMATMTSQGTSADVAATYLRQTIGQLSNPSAKAAQEMRGLGLNATQVAQDLGSKGLAATLTELTDAIQAKMGPSGTVMIETLRKASSNTTEFQKALANLKPSEQTYIGSLATMVGGTKSMMGALQLTGQHMDTFKDNVKIIGEHVKEGGNNVEGWSAVQGTFNQKLAEAKGALEAVGIAIGQKILPYATRFIGWLSEGVTWMTRHKTAMAVLAGAIGGILVVGLAAAAAAAWTFTAALLANPVTWVVVGVMALAAGLVYLLTHWKQVWGWIEQHIPFVANLFRTVWAGSLAAFHAIFDGTMKAVHVIAKWFEDNVIKWILDRVREFMKFWHDYNGEIHAAWKLIWEQIKITAENIWDWLKVGFQLLADTLKAIWDAVVGILKLAWDVIKDVVTFGIHFVENIIKVGLDLITGHWGRALGDIWHLITQAFGDIWRFLSDLGGNLWDLVVNVGSDIINGIVNGIEGAAGAIGRSLTRIAKGALDDVKSFLGINSPSRVFADEVGQWISHGVASGIDQHAGVATTAARNMAGGLSGQFGSIGSLEPAFAGGGSTTFGNGAGAGGATVVNVTVNGSVLSDRDLTDTIQRVMGQNGARNPNTYQPYRR
ncbi:MULTISPECIES: phage tail tape measure protein [unclassified Kitasatospora]|uniref:phage tail tape measure protein n=1 Tax=unclassified Kitasatospora TaxID=2633591 RepID=UPI002473C54F|nr:MULTISPECIES: phage tail tape measure protein [unclassified Kitasatospora]MDH6123858.1 TP901 family phage tail tape measure protein [Kitasatospora sp. GP82]MDH6576043.1 TP901 family phage tail tape measure protein [Kitasatospora sp. MAP5-34]